MYVSNCEIDLSDEMIMFGPRIPFQQHSPIESITKLLRPSSRWAAGQAARCQPNAAVASSSQSMFCAPPELGNYLLKINYLTIPFYILCNSSCEFVPTVHPP